MKLRDFGRFAMAMVICWLLDAWSGHHTANDNAINVSLSLAFVLLCALRETDHVRPD